MQSCPPGTTAQSCGCCGGACCGSNCCTGDQQCAGSTCVIRPDPGDSPDGDGGGDGGGDDGLEDDHKCFSLESKVLTSKGLKSIMQLKIGDILLTIGTNHKSAYVQKETELLGFLHRDFTSKSSFVQVYTTNSSSILTLTPDHLISSMDNNGITKFIAASNLKPGMIVHLGTNLPGLITEVRFTEQIGFLAPITSDGTLIVDNILVSCYVSHKGYPGITHEVSHMALLPYRIAKYFLNFWRSLFPIKASVGVAWDEDLTCLLPLFKRLLSF